MLALVKQKTGSRLGQADFAIYNLAGSHYSTAFHDVVTGDNSVNCAPGSSGCAPNNGSFDFMTGYNAATGYDLASGLGSIDASQLAEDWSSATLTATSSSLQLNGATTPISITHGQIVTIGASVASNNGTPSGLIGRVDNLSLAILPNNESIAKLTLTGGSVLAQLLLCQAEVTRFRLITAAAPHLRQVTRMRCL